MTQSNRSYKKYPKLTPTQEFHKYYKAYDDWVKKEMIKHADEIEANLQKIEAAKELTK